MIGIDNPKKWAARVGIGIALLVVGFVLGRRHTIGGAEDDSHAGHDHAVVSEAKDVKWTCSMHPQFRLPTPGLCPICNMDLIPVEDDDSEMAGLRELSVSEEAMSLMDIETVPVERRFVTTPVRMVGKVEYDETRLATITAWVPGRLDRLFVDYTGVPVRPGDHLVELYSPQLLSGQEELLQACGPLKTPVTVIYASCATAPKIPWRRRAKSCGCGDSPPNRSPPLKPAVK